MYRNLLFLFTIPIVFNLFHCFKPHEEIVQRYLKGNIYNNKQLQKLNTDLCKEAQTDITIRLKICRRIFKLLRDDPEFENPFRQFLYMNYGAFHEQSHPFFPVCQKIQVRVDQNTITDHICMACYGRQAVDSGDDQNLKAIWILYGPNNAVIVFKCSDLLSCKLQEWYDENEGPEETSYLQPPEDLDFIRSIPIPKTAEKSKLMSVFQKDASEIYSMSLNPNNIIHTDNIFDGLCHIMIRRAAYIHKLPISKRKRTTMPRQMNIKQSNCTDYKLTVTDLSVAHTRSPQGLSISKKNTVTVNGYACKTYQIASSDKKTFKIMAGPGENSVILIEPAICNGKPCLIPVELVENIFEYYILHIEEYF